MSKQLRSPLSNARGHGSAKEGVHHWISQKLTAIANIPLVIWFVYSVLWLINQPYSVKGEFFLSPINAILMSLLIISTFYHAALGLQVVIEDYVSCKFKKTASLLLVKLGLFALGAASILAIIKMHLG